ncbi:MAG: TIGR03619 family F420-dependent LLM class oxidoreductase [Deltaproteobacteria bacterium]|nr:TIGR03619 family F420-dependent LLM class oxidoreductase [Deltaproteobacteria bacterium]MBW2361518.1 TIGR03619 family F420-dependent LLM class oxidoreductase [Deltaproteobacteria bacterium]
MKIGVLLNNFGGFPETGRGARACVDLARHAERLGFASVWVTDHIVLPGTLHATYPHGESGFPYTWEQDIHEPIVLMSAVAQATERVEIGVSVLVIPYRHPLLTAKMLATADQLSGGRIVLGAGVGWLRDEFEALGLGPEIFEHRGSVSVDYLRAMQRAWTAEGTVDYAGPYVRFENIGARPQPARDPRIPIWMGGAGERALRRSVELAEGYLAIGSSPEQLAADTARLRELAHSAGRAPESLSVALIDGIVLGSGAAPVPGASLQGSSEQVLDGLRAFAGAGLEHLVAGISLAGNPDFAASVDALEQVAAEILPAASEF